MSKKSVFAFVQLCCRTAALRPSLLQPQPPVHLAAASSSWFPGPAKTTTTPPRGRGGPQTRSIATGFVLPLNAHLGGGDGRAMSAASGRRQAAGRAAGTTTTTAAAVLAATLLLSSPSGAVAGGGAAPFGGWAAGRRRGAHAATTPSMAASAVEEGVTAVGRGAPGQDGAASKPPVVFVLGGPGSGKGTQCERLAKEYGYVHLSAGELLRQERASGSSDGQLIDDYIAEGRIVPVAISLALLRKAMETSEPHSRFLIDGFPRNRDNMEGWDEAMGDVADIRSVLFLYCPEDVLEKRLLSRGKSSGRTDDNAETAKRRFQTYVEMTLPVVEEFQQKGIVPRVDGNQDIESVFRDVLLGLKSVHEKEVLDANRLAVEAVCTGDWAAYAQLCAPGMTEVLGGGLAAVSPDESASASASASPAAISRPQVRMLKGGAAAVVSCERPRGPGLTGGDSGTAVRETRVWEMLDGRWKCVQCHTSL
ncbi:conserved unknown protein [Ectocarpus siliculosus]|uniref:UMP-CMP kinase n=1 Tax=Ectocarpus siliculosus TaxID=2880 RepID=D7FPH2_ECTSI|nr:conserved unknown protein [Ectocarpus siliculosus]|eukprot:CBJ30430.1 conserved unknown protein [Ectocarpus siliculosus]